MLGLKDVDVEYGDGWCKRVWEGGGRLNRASMDLAYVKLM